MTIHKTIRKDKSWSPDHKLVVQIANKNRQVLEFIQQQYGGFINTWHYPIERPNQCVCYKVHLESRKAQYFLEAVLPYLRVKVEQARIGIMLSKLHTVGYGRLNKKNLNSEQLIQREALRQKMLLLNKRGV